MNRMFFTQVRRGLVDIKINPWAQTLTLASVTLIALLGGLFILFVYNLDLELQRTRGDVVFQMYWRVSAEMEQVEFQWDSLRELDYLSDMVTYTPGQGLEELEKGLGEDIDLSWAHDQSPLPATALLFFTPPEEDHGVWSEDMLARLSSLPKVAEVHYNPLRTDIANSWAGNSKRFFWPLIALLTLVLSMIIGNTIKLAMLEKRDEIAILQLVGAKAWYIQTPLVVTGAVHSFLGSLLALGLLKLLQTAARDVLNFPPLFLKIAFFSMDQCLALVAIITLVGILSSRIAVKRLSSRRTV